MKYYKLIILSIGILLLSSCSKEDGSNNLTMPICKPVVLDGGLNMSSSADYLWIIEDKASDNYSFTNTTSSTPTFIAFTAGTYKISFTATDGNKKDKGTFLINIQEATVSPYISKVLDFLPAPGQFTNIIPEYKAGISKSDIIKECETAIKGKKNGDLLSLGGFGGYIVFGFDHTIVNLKGKCDFRVMGNAFYAEANPNPNPDAPKGGSCEPGIIMVAYDKNKNGQPDDDEWYEIAGSEYGNKSTIRNYEITYYRPKAEAPDINPPQYVTIQQYIYWEDNRGNSGYLPKNSYHDQSYYPGWITDDKITFKGTLLPNNAVDESGDGSYWVLYAYRFGYADNIKNNEDGSAIDIGLAVDANGNKVDLPGIDFVKVYTGLNQVCGWIGETSTEISGAYDLHLEGENIIQVK